jgi:hypothetical protein
MIEEKTSFSTLPIAGARSSIVSHRRAQNDRQRRNQDSVQHREVQRARKSIQEGIRLTKYFQIILFHL